MPQEEFAEDCAAEAAFAELFAVGLVQWGYPMGHPKTFIESGCAWKMIGRRLAVAPFLIFFGYPVFRQARHIENG